MKEKNNWEQEIKEVKHKRTPMLFYHSFGQLKTKFEFLLLENDISEIKTSTFLSFHSVLSVFKCKYAVFF